MGASKVLDRISENLKGAGQEAAKRSAVAMDKFAREEARRDTGGDGIMVIKDKYPTRLETVVVKEFARRDGYEVIIRGNAVGLSGGKGNIGPWVWLNSGTSYHVIGKGRRRGRRRVLYGRNWDHPVLGPIGHPGARGKGTWRRAVADLHNELPAIGGEVAKVVTRG